MKPSAVQTRYGAAIHKTLDKIVQRAAEKPPATPLVSRHVFDATGLYKNGPRRACFLSIPKIMDVCWSLPSPSL